MNSDYRAELPKRYASNKPVDVGRVVADGEVVGFGVVVEVVDVVVEVARRVLGIGVQDHAAMRTLEHHFAKGDQLEGR